jgi:hypothetical protein
MAKTKPIVKSNVFNYMVPVAKIVRTGSASEIKELCDKPWDCWKAIQRVLILSPIPALPSRLLGHWGCV